MRLNFSSVGLAASAMLILALASLPVDAQSRRQQRIDGDQSYSHGVTVWPRYTPREYVVCYNGCNNSGTIVLGADPDPNIRSQIQRDHNYFGGAR
jgi:hypothetical protein